MPVLRDTKAPSRLVYTNCMPISPSGKASPPTSCHGLAIVYISLSSMTEARSLFHVYVRAVQKRRARPRVILDTPFKSARLHVPSDGAGMAATPPACRVPSDRKNKSTRQSKLRRQSQSADDRDSSIRLCRVKRKRKQRDQKLDASSKPKHALQAPLATHEPTANNGTHEQGQHGNSSAIPLDVVESE